MLADGSAETRVGREEPCPIARGMHIPGGQWKGSNLWHLEDGPVRFNALARPLGGASKKTIDQRLKGHGGDGAG